MIQINIIDGGTGSPPPPINNIDINHILNVIYLSFYTEFNPIGLVRPIARHLFDKVFPNGCSFNGWTKPFAEEGLKIQKYMHN